MRNAGRLKLGYYPLPIEEARNLRSLLIAPQPFFAVDPCAGDGTALAESRESLPAQNAAIELDADRAAAAAAAGSQPPTAAPSSRTCRPEAARCCTSILLTTWRWDGTATSDWNWCSSTIVTDG